MAKTFNRRPLQVNTPSSNDVKNYFFNHYNWKGLCTDKNFLAVDQETFADAKNVYVDAEGLLKSRPSVKRKKMLFDSAIDFWNFDDVNVSLCTTEKYGNYLVAEKNGVKVTTEYNLLYRDLKLTRLGNIIYIFSKHHFLYFDVEEMKFGDGFEKTYVPTTVFDSVGVKTKDEKSNILTDKEKHIYQYSRELGISNEVYGKELKVKINGSEYNLVFDQYTPELLTDVLLKVPDFYDGVRFNDPKIGITWKDFGSNPIMNERDMNYELL